MTKLERESVLVEAAGSGSRPAFDELLKVHRTPMIRIAFTIVHDFDEAEDVTQIASLRAFRSLHTFVPHASFFKWLAAIVRNAAIDSMRRKKPQAEFFEDRAGTTNLRFCPEYVALRGDERAALACALALLPHLYRDSLELYYMSELSYNEIAECLRLPIGTVKTHLYRGKALLRNNSSLITAICPA